MVSSAWVSWTMELKTDTMVKSLLKYSVPLRFLLTVLGPPLPTLAVSKPTGVLSNEALT